MNTATMTFFTIDTLQFSKRLQKVGVEQKIADEFAEAIKDTHAQSIQGLATKEDIKIVEQKIESLEYKLTVKMFLMLTAAVAMIAWLDKVIN